MFILMGGDFPSEADYSAQIRSRAAQIPNVTITGRIPNHEVEATLRRAAALVNTSDVEGFPNAYLEAWSLRVPVIARRDIDGIIVSSGAGVVAESLDEMERALRSLEDDGTRRAMGEAARRCAVERFSPQRLGAEYVNFFSELLDSPQRGAALSTR
jgi:glycosyltransferase involved in cell wall biosynthesis